MHLIIEYKLATKIIIIIVDNISKKFKQKVVIEKIIIC